jgi:hypothetical protein
MRQHVELYPFQSWRFLGIYTLTSKAMLVPSPVVFTLLCPLLVCPVPSTIMKLFAVASVFALSSILVSGSASKLYILTPVLRPSDVANSPPPTQGFA